MLHLTKRHIITSLHSSKEEPNSINPPSNHITKNIQRSKRCQQNTLNLTPMNTTENAYKRFFIVYFEPTLIRTIDAYDVVGSAEKLTGVAPVSLVINGKTSFSIKCASQPIQASRILSQVGNISCMSTLQHIQRFHIYLLSLTSTTCKNSKISFLQNTPSQKLNKLHSSRPNQKILTLSL